MCVRGGFNYFLDRIDENLVIVCLFRELHSIPNQKTVSRRDTKAFKGTLGPPPGRCFDCHWISWMRWCWMLDMFTTSVGSLTRQHWAFLQQLHAHTVLLHTSQAFLLQSGVVHLMYKGQPRFSAFQRQLGQIWWDTTERKKFCSSNRWLPDTRWDPMNKSEIPIRV